MNTASDLYVVIVGCGRLGTYVAERYSLTGAGVVTIDQDVDALGALSPEYSGFTIEGDAREYSVLTQAKTGSAQCFFALTDSDNLNVMVGSIAKQHFGVPRVVVRVADPDHEEVFASMGLEIICPTRIAARSAVADLDSPEVFGGTGGVGTETDRHL